MAEAHSLKKFLIEEKGEGFQIQIEDDAGGTMTLDATREQVDVIADNLDDLLSETEEFDEVDDEDKD